jgi:hypothetical protein
MPGARFFFYSTPRPLSCPMGVQGGPIAIGYEGPLFSPSSPPPLLLLEPILERHPIGHGSAFKR